MALAGAAEEIFAHCDEPRLRKAFAPLHFLHLRLVGLRILLWYARTPVGTACLLMSHGVTPGDTLGMSYLVLIVRHATAGDVVTTYPGDKTGGCFDIYFSMYVITRVVQRAG